jgi:hypothetical protein
MKEEDHLCELGIRSINAPFNIMGVLGFEGYYVTHSWTENTMSFVPYKDSLKVDLEPRGDLETAYGDRHFKLKMESENTEDAETIAILIATGVALLILGITGAIVYGMINDKTGSGIEIAAWAGGGTLTAIIAFFLLWWIML